MTSSIGRSAHSSAVLHASEHFESLWWCKECPTVELLSSKACGGAINIEKLHTWLSQEMITEEIYVADTVVIIVDIQLLSKYGYFATTVELWYCRVCAAQRWECFVFVPHDSRRFASHAFIASPFLAKHMILSDADCAPCVLKWSRARPPSESATRIISGSKFW